MPKSLNAIGLVEFSSIAKGIEACDAMVKVGGVKLISALPLCPGKYITLVVGEVSQVQSAVQAAITIGKETVIDQLVIANVDPSVFPALTASTTIKELKALGILETFTVASGIQAADICVKAAPVELIEIRIAKGLGGKSFVILTGEVAAVEDSIRAAIEFIKPQGLLVAYSVIPAPHPQVLEEIM